MYTHSQHTVAIIGGGVAGVSVALNLAMRGLGVHLFEREQRLGGRALDVCCKALAGECQFCGGCLLADRLAALRAEPRVALHLGAQPTDIERAHAFWRISWPEVETLVADALIIATGFDHIDARTKGPYGLGLLPQVISGEELEHLLRREGQAALDGRPLARIAFIQCVGSRDAHAGRDYCSQVCCRYGVRLARWLKKRHPQAEITVFKMDIQAGGREFAPVFTRAQAEGIRFVAGLPAVIRRETDGERAGFDYEDALTGEIQHAAFDLIVLATGMQPRADAARLAEMLGLEQGAWGLAAEPDGIRTRAPGVFLAGACAAPRSIAESIAHAQAAAEACALYLAQRDGAHG